jgi:AraC-like DNA-binding protein
VKNMTKLSPDDPRLAEALKRLAKRESSLTDESRKLGYSHNGQLRRALRARLGEVKYAALMDGATVAGIRRWRAEQAAAKAKG